MEVEYPKLLKDLIFIEEDFLEDLKDFTYDDRRELTTERELYEFMMSKLIKWVRKQTPEYIALKNQIKIRKETLETLEKQLEEM